MTALTNVSASNTGTVVFRTGGPEMSDLAWFDRGGQRQETVWEPNSFNTVGLSPDGLASRLESARTRIRAAFDAVIGANSIAALSD